MSTITVSYAGCITEFPDESFELSVDEALETFLLYLEMQHTVVLAEPFLVATEFNNGTLRAVHMYEGDREPMRFIYDRAAAILGE